jgi:6-phosphogluconolactonase
MLQTVSAKSDLELYTNAAPWVVDAVAACCRKQGYCVLGIVGGRSIPSLLQRIKLYASEISGKVHIFWLDERVTEEKNYPDALPQLEQIRSAGVDLHWYPLQATTEGDIMQEANDALQKIKAIKGATGFDVVIASAGEDGHVAGLFPNKPALQSKDSGYTLVHGAPKPPPLRVSVTPHLLQSAHSGFLFFVGEKRHAYERFSDTGIPISDCPAKLLLSIPKLSVFTCLR